MDELKARLKSDAARIESATSKELRARLDASLHTVLDARTTAVDRPAMHESQQATSWWPSALTGIAALLIIVFFVNRDASQETNQESVLAGNPHSIDTALPKEWLGSDGLALNIKSADLTRSLEQELANLQSDLEKARDNVERDVKFAF